MKRNNIMSDKFNKRMDELKNFLDQIGKEFNIQYSFNYLKLSENSREIEQKDMLYSANLGVDSLEAMINNHLIIKNRILSVTKLIENGNIICCCVKDYRNGIDEVHEGSNYIVDAITYDGGVPRYHFRGKKTPFTSDKFIILSGFGLN